MKGVRRTVAAVAACVITLAAAGPAGAQERRSRGDGADGQAPVQITAEEAEYLSAENRVVFTGTVVAVQGDATITADRMEVRLLPAEPEGGEPPPAGGILAAGSGGTRLETIVATGNVTFRQADAEAGTERYATGERGEYDAVGRVVTLTGGSPRAWEGQNVVNCEKMVFALEEHSMNCSGKVQMTVYPSESSGEGKGPEPSAGGGAEGEPAEPASPEAAEGP